MTLETRAVVESRQGVVVLHGSWVIEPPAGMAAELATRGSALRWFVNSKTEPGSSSSITRIRQSNRRTYTPRVFCGSGIQCFTSNSCITR